MPWRRRDYDQQSTYSTAAHLDLFTMSARFRLRYVQANVIVLFDAVQYQHYLNLIAAT